MLSKHFPPCASYQVNVGFDGLLLIEMIQFAFVSSLFEPEIEGITSISLWGRVQTTPADAELELILGASRHSAASGHGRTGHYRAHTHLCDYQNKRNRRNPAESD